MEALWSSLDITMSNEDCELMARLFYNEEEEEIQNPSFSPPLMSWTSPPPPPSPSFNCSNYRWNESHCLVGEKIFQQKASAGEVAASVSPPENLNPLEDHEPTSSCNGVGDCQLLRRKRKFEYGGASSESAKRVRVFPTNVRKGVKNAASKRAHKRSCDEEDYINTTNWVNSSCSYSSDDDSKTLQDVNGIGGKRSDQEPSTNPQSLYARKRREKINERLKILQNLVPNGTKVDISTMLEEAVHYVKFLQMQIKLLSSDELWMYAPIAYNGVNIGVDLKISPPLE